MTIDTGRLQRAIWLDCQPVAPGRYLVRGGSADHVVEVDGGLVRCHCPDSQRVGDSCKHSLALRLRAGDGEVVDALRQLVPNPRHFPAKKAREIVPGATISGDRGEEQAR